MIAFPLAPSRSARRARISNVVVGGLAATTAANASARWGAARVLLGAAAIGGGTLAVERVGTATGWPFGRYRYTGRLRPALGGVPVTVPAAWWAMAVPAREAAHAALSRHSTRLSRTVVGAAALTAWDLFLDPQMTAESYWRWRRPGRYRGIPLSNYAGWLATGLGVMLVLDVVLPPRAPDLALAGEYLAMGVMETLGFALFFGDRVVAATGAVAMLPLGAWALGRARG
jgi:putative membrane protein